MINLTNPQLKNLRRKPKLRQSLIPKRLRKLKKKQRIMTLQMRSLMSNLILLRVAFK